MKAGGPRNDGGPSSGSDSGPQTRDAHLSPPLAGRWTDPSPRGRLPPLSSHRCRRHAAQRVCYRDSGALTWRPKPRGLARLCAGIGSHRLAGRLPRLHWVSRSVLPRPRAPTGLTLLGGRLKRDRPGGLLCVFAPWTLEGARDEECQVPKRDRTQSGWDKSVPVWHSITGSGGGRGSPRERKAVPASGSRVTGQPVDPYCLPQARQAVPRTLQPSGP